MSPTAAAGWISLTKEPGTVSEETAAASFNRLEPVSPEFLMGEWKGNDIKTGHPGVQINKELRWAGKSFRSVDDVDPMVVYNDAGNRVFKEDIGHARVREVKYNGVVSAAMIYDTKPIIDHFRKVDNNTVAGVMDTPLMKEMGQYYFYLTRL